jgi:Na+/H+ antiporter NhaD/arsenite permease-like protein
MLLASISAMKTLVITIKKSQIKRWWAECMRGIVACWLNVVDDSEMVMNDQKREDELRGIMLALREVVTLLKKVELDFEEMKIGMLAVEDGLEGLFEDVNDGDIVILGGAGASGSSKLVVEL